MNGAKPKLLVFSHLCSATYITGAEKLLMLFAREWIHHFQCVLVVPKEGIIAAQARSFGIQVIVFEIPLCLGLYFSSPSVPGHIQTLKSYFVYQRLLSLLVGERPSFVWANTSVHPLPAIAAKSLGIPTVWTLMEQIHDEPHRKLALDTVHHASTLIAGISRTTLLPFKWHPGEAKTIVIPPFVAREDLDAANWPFFRWRLRQQLGWDETHTVIGYMAGTIYPLKGLEPFIRAAQRLKDTNPLARFLVVGNPVDEGHFHACTTMVNQAGMAHQFGWIRFDEHIQHLYPAMDIVAVTSLQAEGFGMTALEGMHFGKPVVAFASGGLAEILQATGNERFLIRMGDVGDLTAKIRILTDDQPQRMFVGQTNEHAAQAVFGVEAFRQQMHHLADRLALRFNPPSALIKGRGRSVYLVENRHRRPFVSEKAFVQRGFRFEDVRPLTEQELKRYRRGSSIKEWHEPSRRRKSRSRRTGRRLTARRRRVAERTVRKTLRTRRRIRKRLSKRR